MYNNYSNQPVNNPYQQPDPMNNNNMQYSNQQQPQPQNTSPYNTRHVNQQQQQNSSDIQPPSSYQPYAHHYHHLEEGDLNSSEEEESSEGEDEDFEQSGGGHGGGGQATTPTSSGRRSSRASGSSTKKSRISQACDSCRRRKRRCDGSRPTCSPCSKLHMSCTYPVYTKKRGPEAGVVKRLRQEVKLLEQELNSVKSSNLSPVITAKQEYQQSYAPQQHNQYAQQQQPSSMLNSPSTTSHNSQQQPDRSMHISQPVTNFNQPHGSHITLRYIQSHSNYLLYINTYFQLINNVFLPFLNQHDFTAEQQKYKDLAAFAQQPNQQQSGSMLEPPVSWNLRVGAAVALGSLAHGDKQFSMEAAQLARSAANELFDIPSTDVLRGLLILSFLYLGTNQSNAAMCYTAVAARLCDLCRNEVGDEIPLLSRLIDDWLNGSQWFTTGYDALPPNGWEAVQADRFPKHKAFYQRLIKQFTSAPYSQQLYSIKKEPASPMKSKSAKASNKRKSSTDDSVATINDPEGILHSGLGLSGGELNDVTIRWRLLQAMAELGACRGEVAKPPTTSIYAYLALLVVAEHSNLSSAFVRLLVIHFKAYCYTVMGDSVLEQSGLVHLTPLESLRLSPANEQFLKQHNSTLQHITPAHWHANIVSTLALQTDVTYCGMYAVVFHLIAQVHLRYGDDRMLAIDMEVLERIAANWDCAKPMLRNLQYRLADRIKSLQMAAGQTQQQMEPTQVTSQELRNAATHQYGTNVEIPHISTSFLDMLNIDGDLLSGPNVQLMHKNQQPQHTMDQQMNMNQLQQPHQPPAPSPLSTSFMSALPMPSSQRQSSLLSASDAASSNAAYTQNLLLNSPATNFGLTPSLSSGSLALQGAGGPSPLHHQSSNNSFYQQQPQQFQSPPVSNQPFTTVESLMQMQQQNPNAALFSGLTPMQLQQLQNNMYQQQQQNRPVQQPNGFNLPTQHLNAALPMQQFAGATANTEPSLGPHQQSIPSTYSQFI